MKLVKLLVSGLGIAMLLLAACNDAGSAAQQILDIEVDNMTLAEVMAFSDSSGFRVTEIMHEYEIAGQPIVGSLPIKEGDTLEQLEREWKRVYPGMLADLIESAPPPEASPSSQGVADSATEIAAGFEVALASGIVPNFKATKLVATQALGNATSLNISQANSHPKVKAVRIRGKLSTKQIKAFQENYKVETSSHKSWSPDYGWIYSGPSSSYSNNRYITNYMWWRDNTFLSSEGYEHDLRLNNDPNSSLGPGTYLEITQNAAGYPTYTYWSTSWPSSSYPYRDTRFGDGNQEIAFSFGMARANNITTGRWYYTYIVERPGTASRDNGKQTNQLMNRSVPGCTSQWCMFGKPGETVRAVPAWGVDLPGREQWTY